MKNGANAWLHKNCTIISINIERCSACKNYNKNFVQKMSRVMKSNNIKRLSAIKNPLNRVKFAAMQKALKLQARQNANLKKKIVCLQNALIDAQNKMATLNDVDLQSIENKNQRIVIQEIISAARRTDSRGRRYQEDFIMLCMLMNIRSQSYYEFLRKTNIIPLPCTKTIRDYVSLINRKCGYDENFFKVLKKEVCVSEF